MDNEEKESKALETVEEENSVATSTEEELLRQQMKEEEKLRTIGLFGDIDQTRAEEVIYGLYTLNASKLKKLPVDFTDLSKGLVELVEPVEFLISTVGGDACDMFAIYDTIRYLRSGMEIETYGLGKVMSAGVLLLASGTRGKRKIGKNCRVMIHGVASASQGNISNLKTEMTEIKKMQEMYIEGLVEETNLTKAQLKRIMNKNVNVYLSAEEAVKYGIADIIV
jgi:ATP-dependent Clp endopeptidase proteolytic subunit ClpP